MLRQDALARLVHMRAAFHRFGEERMIRKGSNLSDKGLNLSGSWQQGHSATTIPVGVFKLDAQRILPPLGGNYNSKAVERLRPSGLNSDRAFGAKLLLSAAVAAPLAFQPKRDDQLCESAVPRTSFKFRRSKGSIGRAFRGSYYVLKIRIKRAFTLLFHREISVLVELILGHLRYLLTDVPPQPNSPPDNVLARIDPRASLGSKEGLLPASDSADNQFPLSYQLSWLFGAESVPSPSPADREAVARPLAAQAAANSRRVGLGPRPSPQSQSFSSSDPFCRLPLPTLFHRPGCSPWRPDAVMIRPVAGFSVLRIFKSAGNARTPQRRRGALPRWTLPPAEPFRSGQAVKQKR
ncbi:hypothetical protein Bca52824_096619 [Brassica carinata]|uniref:Senescence-associated protein n=1 Tax=Brassica carinata TaxID=52824 RepID=A0A8X7THM1_BRACI|nr:hypothetical protein Bca52824_096619 [Brassica carinata]